MVCGHDSLLWRKSGNALYCIRIKRQDADVPRVNALIDRAYEIVDYGSYASLKTMMFQTRHSKCTDDRDRIYAMLGMLHDTDAELAIRPDYTKPSKEVYQELVLRYIDRQQQLSILLLCELRSGVPTLPSWVPNFAIPNTARPLLNMRATGDSLCNVESTGGDALQVAGLWVCTLRHLEILESTAERQYPRQDVIEAARRFASTHDMSSNYLDSTTLREAYCRTMCAGPVLDEILQSDGGGLVDASPAAKKFLDYAKDTCSGRSFFQTAMGHIGVGPRIAEKDDLLCVLLGCGSPMLLRAARDNSFRLVGECFVPGLMCNEAILGPLPGKFTRVSKLDETWNSYVGAFVDMWSGEARVEDPMLGVLPYGCERKVHEREKVRTIFVHENYLEGIHDRDLRLSKSALLDQGIVMEAFNLI
ncbi:hypothetical protein LTR08_009016 [Meristemomyces frigidus]|nr:hypothetical protein LTR08_009016 [Meristemomyces frigidus]